MGSVHHRDITVDTRGAGASTWQGLTMARPPASGAYAPRAGEPHEDQLDARLSLDAVSVRFGGLQALDGVSLDVSNGEIVCLLGPSGSGKSTLLRVVAGVDRPSAGRVAIDGVEVAGPNRFVEPERRRVGMVFQDYALFPHLTVTANVAFGLHGRTRAETARVVGGLLERLDLDRYARSFPHTLSGGERQRVALARALAPAPRLLLMDEPFSSLDDRLRDRVRAQTLDLLRETRTTTIVVTHDPDEAMRIADRIALLHRGRLVQCGTPDELYLQPATLAAARFFSDVNELPGVSHQGVVQTPLGGFAAPHLSDRTPAVVCLRPQHVRVAAQPTAVAARVVRSAFLGEIDQIVVAVDGLEATMTIRTFGRTALEPGDVVHLDVDPKGASVFARDPN